MKHALLLPLIFCACDLPCQTPVPQRWNIAVGVSSVTFYMRSHSYNIRYISPRFKWSEYELDAEEELRADEFRNSRLMVEMIYTPPLDVLCTSFTLRSRLLHSRKISLDIYGGMRFFFVPGPDFAQIPYLNEGKQMWYMNLGLLVQFNLGMISPFVDIGGDKIVTAGVELDLRNIYKKPKRRYNIKKPKKAQ